MPSAQYKDGNRGGEAELGDKQSRDGLKYYGEWKRDLTKSV